MQKQNWCSSVFSNELFKQLNTDFSVWVWGSPEDNPCVMLLPFLLLLLIRLVGRVKGSMGGRLGVTWILLPFIGGEKAQLTKDKKWTVNTLNKAQQTRALSLSLASPSDHSSHSPPPTPLAHSLSLLLPSQKEGSELTKCQLTLNVCPSHLPLWTADSSGVWVNTKGLAKNYNSAPCPIPLSLPLLSFYFVSNGVVLQFNAQSKGDIKWLSKEFHLRRRQRHRQDQGLEIN